MPAADSKGKNEMKKTGEKYIAAIEAAAIFAIMAAMYYLNRFWFENNDDIIISGLLSGSLAGTEQWRIYQYDHVILSFLMSVLYRAIPAVPWYGSLLVLLHFLAGFLPLNAINSMVRDKKMYLITFPVWCSLFAAFWHLHSRIQYTSTAEMAALVGFVCFCFYENRKKAVGAFLFFEIFAFLLRPNAMELMAPVGLTVLLLRFGRDKESGRRFKTLFSGAAICVLIVLIGTLITKVEYADREYREADAENTARMQMFDYAGCPEYEEVEDILSEYDISKEKYYAFRHYLILDWDNSEGVLAKIADRSASNVIKPFIAGEILLGIGKLTLKNSFTFLPFLIALSWILAIIAVFLYKRFEGFMILLFYLAMKCVSWGYVVYNGRMPSRVVTPLIYAECVVVLSVFLWIVLTSNRSEVKALTFVRPGAVLVSVCATVLLSGLCMKEQYRSLSAERNTEILINEAYGQLKDYCNNDRDHIYILPSESYTYLRRSVFETDKQDNNFIFTGGWYSLLPDALRHVDEYLSQDKGCFFLMPESTQDFVKEIKLGYLEEYFGTEPELTDSLVLATGENYSVYRVRQ
ncbi:MAG: hypothetical protein K6D96_10555 [Acetatifactor sp.]|nr:hypothetical protein [Acetatifactor sp.]